MGQWCTSSDLPGWSFQLPADADVDLHGLQRPLLLWFDALNDNTEQLGHRDSTGAHWFTELAERYLLVFEQQQFVLLDLERSFLEPISLKELGRFLTTLQQTDLRDVTLIGWTGIKNGQTEYGSLFDTLGLRVWWSTRRHAERSRDGGSVGPTGQDVDAVSFRDSLHHQVGCARVGHLAPLQSLLQDLLFGV